MSTPSRKRFGEVEVHLEIHHTNKEENCDILGASRARVILSLLRRFDLKHKHGPRGTSEVSYQCSKYSALELSIFRTHMKRGTVTTYHTDALYRDHNN